MKNMLCTACVCCISFLAPSLGHADKSVCEIFKPDPEKYLHWEMNIVSTNPTLGIVKFINPNENGLIPFIIGTYTTLEDGKIDLILIQYPVGGTPCVGVQSARDYPEHPEYPSREQRSLPSIPRDRKLGI